MGAIGIHHTDTDEGAWDGPANEARLRIGESAAYYRLAYAWVDPEKDPETKAAYKFPHHLVDGEGAVGAANVKACQSGIGVLNGSMGGTNIPDSDRRGVYNHLAAHLRDAGVEPADLRTMPTNNTRTIERRYFPAEMRVDAQGRIEGYAAVFNQLSEELWGGFREKIRQGAFAKTIQEADVRGLFNHDPNYVLGRNRAGTLDLADDVHGLHFRATPPEATWVSDLKLSIQRGDIDQGSFGFDTIRDEWRSDENNMTQRELIEVKLWDVSVVTFPAYPQTSVGLRTLAQQFIARAAVQADPDLVQELISELNTMLPAAPVQEGHPAGNGAADDEVQVRLVNLRHRLELAELA